MGERGHLGKAGLVLFKRKFNCFTTSESFKGSWVKTPPPQEPWSLHISWVGTRSCPGPTSVPSSPAAARLLAPQREGGVHSGAHSAAVPACEGDGLPLLQQENPSQPAATNPAAGKAWPSHPLGLLLKPAALTLQSNTLLPQHSTGQHPWVQAEGPTGLTPPQAVLGLPPLLPCLQRVWDMLLQPLLPMLAPCRQLSGALLAPGLVWPPVPPSHSRGRGLGSLQLDCRFFLKNSNGLFI